MWGVTRNPGSHHRQKNRGVTRNWSSAPRLINAETKKQSHARRLSVGLFYFRASWGSQQLTRWQGQETPLQSAGNGSLWWAQHTWEITCHMGSHSVTGHPAAVTFTFTPAKAGNWFIGQRDARLSWRGWSLTCVEVMVCWMMLFPGSYLVCSLCSIWYCGSKAVVLQCRSALSLPCWRCGLASLYHSRLLARTLASRRW